jgi:hypothetical protein
MANSGGERWAWLRAVELHNDPGDFPEFAPLGRALREAREDVDQLTHLAVERARHRGVSWTDIGKALGVTRQTVQKKYSDVG